eukprot:TRINITY_DN115955_c0_g1_i1.p1 TRINITY_DN115955_c0_g1~~TRINITY_DN115955_c0_g1_i1.p1  ORF type:complete len:108 (+),score=40.92 TRINITY_DN115955_c0_g1_i1:89-412(+)
MSGKNDPNAVPKKTKEQEILNQVEEVKGIMHNNIDKMVKNIDNLEVLQDKTDNMRESSLQFRKGARDLKSKMWWKNLKAQLVIALVIIIILTIIILSIVIPLVKKNN